METIPYRNTKIPIKTIPKGTLLFRIVEKPEDDLRGVKLEDGTRCLTPNYNVFFHPNPFVGNFALKGWIQNQQKLIHVYKLKNDIKILWLVNPSKYSRRTKNSKSMFIKRCSTVKKGCLPKSGSDYDPCVSKTLIEKYPDVVGMLAISIGDTREMKRGLKKTQRLQKYFKFAKDIRGVSGVPELILHPLTSRPSGDIITQEADKLTNNYEEITSFDRFNIHKLEDFMKKHATYDPATYFYTYH
jgi:hypothetical protein